MHGPANRIKAAREHNLITTEIHAELAMLLEARGQLWLSWSKTSQAMTRALAGVLGAAWLLLRTVLRALPPRGEPG